MLECGERGVSVLFVAKGLCCVRIEDSYLCVDYFIHFLLWQFPLFCNEHTSKGLYRTLVNTTITFRKTMYLFRYKIVYKIATNRSPLTF